MDNIGINIGQRLVLALVVKGIPYIELERIVYRELRSINEEIKKGDWIEFPNGQMYYASGRMKGE